MLLRIIITWHVEGQISVNKSLASFVIIGLIIGMQFVCVHPQGKVALYPQERPGTHFTRGWVGPRAGLDGRKISSPPEFDPGPSSP